jgi:hypothetical protein
MNSGSFARSKKAENAILLYSALSISVTNFTAIVVKYERFLERDEPITPEG